MENTGNSIKETFENGGFFLDFLEPSKTFVQINLGTSNYKTGMSTNLSTARQ